MRRTSTSVLNFFAKVFTYSQRNEHHLKQNSRLPWLPVGSRKVYSLNNKAALQSNINREHPSVRPPTPNCKLNLRQSAAYGSNRLTTTRTCSIVPQSTECNSHLFETSRSVSSVGPRYGWTCQIPLTICVLSLSSLTALRSWLSFLQSSSPSHLWSSNIRCLPQKCPSQNPQSPTIRCAASLHSLKEHLIFLGGISRHSEVYGVEVEDRGRIAIWEVEGKSPWLGDWWSGNRFEWRSLPQHEAFWRFKGYDTARLLRWQVFVVGHSKARVEVRLGRESDRCRNKENGNLVLM